MNRLPAFPLDLLRRRLRATAVIAGVVAAGLVCVTPAAFLPAYRFAAFACLAPAVGSLLVALLHRTTGGQWGGALAPFLSAGSRLAPWIWLAVLLLLVFPGPAPAWPGYASRPLLALRGGIGAAVLFVFSGLLNDGKQNRGWLGPVGLIVLVFTLHILADDWLAALDPDWHSTAFALVWITGQAVAGLAAAILMALVAGKSPEETPAAPRALGLDWGNLLLAMLLFWCYVAFAQFLIIWMGNLPAEIAWFQRRQAGAWSLVPPLLAVIHFAVPLAVLLSRAAKRSAGLLAGTAALLLAAQVIFLAWIILPAFPHPAQFHGLPAGVLAVTGLAWFFNRYLAPGVQPRQPGIP